MANGIKANIKNKADHIDSLRRLGSAEVKKIIAKADQDVEAMEAKEEADR